MALAFPIPDDSAYIYEQHVPATLWRIEHNLGTFPSVTIVDSGNSVNHGEVTYVSENVIEVRFSAGFAGKAYLN